MKTRTAILSALCLANLPAFAGTSIPSVEPGPTASPWSCRFEIYGWAQALNGDSGVRGYTAPVNASFRDILSNLKFVAMGAVEINYNRWVVLADMDYATLGVSGSGPGLTSFDVNLHQFVGNFVVTYEAFKTDTMKFDVYAGVRVNSISLDFNITGPLGNTYGRAGSKSWVDPVIGARYQQDLGHDVFFRAAGDIGGFGVSSQFTWQAMAGFGYSFHEYGSLLLGYRGLGTDYSNGGFTYDVIAHGPVIGYEWKF